MRPKCTGRNKHTKQPCGAYPVTGSKVCRMHGGSAPQVRAAAAVRVVEAQARAAVEKFTITPVTNPLEVLAELAGELVGFKDYLRGLMSKISDEQMRVEGFGPAPEQMRAELTAYQNALTSTTGLLVQIGKLGIEERMARLNEQHKLIIIRALQSGLAEAGITGPQAQRALSATGRHLQVAGKAAA